MIYKPDFEKLRNSELLQFLYDVTKICKNNDAEALGLDGKLTPLVQQTQDLDDVFQLARGSKITEQLIQLDTIRDNYVVGIKTVLTGLTNHYDEAMVASAKALLETMDAYDTSIQRLNYSSETSTINSLTDDWQNKPLLSTHLNKVGLVEWAGKLKTVNNSFSDLYLERVKENADAPDLKAVDVKKACVESYRSLVDTIDAHHVLAEDDTYLQLIKELNVLIGEYNQRVENRTGSPEEMAEETE